MERLSSGDMIATTQSALPPFALYRPGSVSEAVACLQDADAPAVFYAGGTDIFAKLRQGLRPASLIWLDLVAELTAAEAGRDALTLGAGLTHAAAVAHPALASVPGLSEAWGRIATTRIRRHATLGGNLMARHTRYELSILFSALSATARLATPAGAREMPVQDLWALPAEERALLVSVTVPLAGAPRLDYARDLRPDMTLAVCARGEGRGDLPAARLALATQYLRPFVADLAPGADPAQALDALPQSAETPAASRGWLIRAGAALAKRQLDRLGAA